MPTADDDPVRATDVKITAQLMKRSATWTTFVGMPSLDIRVWRTWEQLRTFGGLIASMQQVELTLLDARARSATLPYAECGFTLVPLQSECTDWAAAAQTGTAENDRFQAELKKEVLKLHPSAVKVEFMAFLLRGGLGENKPAAGSIHLDMFPDDNEREAWDAQNVGVTNNVTHATKEALQKDLDADAYELGEVLGLWKPRQTANPVYDYPMMLCDASSITADDVIPQYQRFPVKTPEGQTHTVVNVAGSLKHADAQRWFYYPQQTHEELLVFRHKTPREPIFCNFHAAAKLPLPEGAETRSSIEMRAFLFYPKGWAAKQAAK